MSINMDSFRQAKFGDRTEAVPVPDMAYMFDADKGPKGGKKPVKAEWVVRGLTAAELHQSAMAAQGRGVAEMLVTAISDASIPKANRGKAVADALGLSGEDVPEEIKKRMEMLVIATVGVDDFTIADAATLQTRHPIEFMTITNKIVNLTGQGQVQEKESKPSGKTKA